MKVVGVIAEYNPFHNGHRYQLEQLKKETGADYVIIAMSGNFLQRGVPALCDKYARTKMALSCGADLVLEIPALWATASAEYFAKGGVSVLKNTGLLTHLGFGAETDDLEGLKELASILKNEPQYYKDELADALREGMSFPAARKKALKAMLYVTGSEMSEERVNDLLDSPNNILAIEYLKTLPDYITPVLIPRKGSGYHDTEIDTPFPSASAIRSVLFRKDTLSEGVNFTDTIDVEQLLSESMPEESYKILKDIISEGALLDTEDISEILGYRLLSLSKYGYADYGDCTTDFSNKILNHLKDYTCFDAFCQSLKSKDLTYTRICRNLLHILLDIRNEDYDNGSACGYVPYLRMLGFRKESADLLSEIKEKAHVPLISKVADADSLLTPECYEVFEKDLSVSAIYHQLLTTRKGQPAKNDFTSQIVIL